MSGRRKIKTYQYDSNGKFIRRYDSIQEVRNLYYRDYVGKYPILTKSDLHFLPDNTVLSKSRIGRERVKFEFALKTNPLINVNNTKNTGKPIEVFDLLGDKVAEFKDAKTASVLMNMSQSTVVNSVTRANGKKRRHNKYGIDMKFKK